MVKKAVWIIRPMASAVTPIRAGVSSREMTMDELIASIRPEIEERKSQRAACGQGSG